MLYTALAIKDALSLPSVHQIIQINQYQIDTSGPGMECFIDFLLLIL